MEQQLIEDLIIESMGIYGHSVYYCPRTLINFNQLYGEDPVSEYNGAYMLDAYIRSYDNYEGDGTFLSKFNLEIRDQIKFTIARRVFADTVGVYTSLDRIQEGDLIYSSMMKRLFVVTYVNNNPIFYQLGALQTWDVVCEVFEYSSERLNTGIAEIDDIEKSFSIDIEQAGIQTNDGITLVDNSGFAIDISQFVYADQLMDTFEDNDDLTVESALVIDWSITDPFSEAI